MSKLTPVKVEDAFRVCYAGTEKIAVHVSGQPLDAVFDVQLDQEAAMRGKAVWKILLRKGGPGFHYKQRALRFIEMLAEEEVNYIPLEDT